MVFANSNTRQHAENMGECYYQTACWKHGCLLIVTPDSILKTWAFANSNTRQHTENMCEQVLFVYFFYNNPAPLNGSTQFHYCTDSNPGTGADDAFVLKRGVLRNATWPSHSRLAIAAGACHFQICFLPEYFDQLFVYLLFVYLVLFMH